MCQALAWAGVEWSKGRGVQGEEKKVRGAVPCKEKVGTRGDQVWSLHVCRELLSIACLSSWLLGTQLSTPPSSIAMAVSLLDPECIQGCAPKVSTVCWNSLPSESPSLPVKLVFLSSLLLWHQSPSDMLLIFGLGLLPLEGNFYKN